MNISNQYIAGFIDGEAYIGLIKKTSNKCTLGFYYKPNIKVAQRTKYGFVLEKLKEKYGGYITTRKQLEQSNQCAVDTWEIANKPMVKELLMDIKDFSIVKNEHIKLLLEFIDFPSTHIDRNNNKRKDEIYAEMRKLNKRGLAETK